MLFAAQSDFLQICIALINLVGMMFAGYMAYLMAKLKTTQADMKIAQANATVAQAEKVEEVKKTLAAVSVVTARKVDSMQKAIEAAKAETAAKTAEVAQQLVETEKEKTAKLDKIEAKLDINTETTERTHKLVNGDMSMQLRLVAEKSKRLADITHDPKDVADAEEAKKRYEQHEAKQTEVEK